MLVQLQPSIPTVNIANSQQYFFDHTDQYSHCIMIHMIICITTIPLVQPITYLNTHAQVGQSLSLNEWSAAVLVQLHMNTVVKQQHNMLTIIANNIEKLKSKILFSNPNVTASTCLVQRTQHMRPDAIVKNTLWQQTKPTNKKQDLDCITKIPPSIQITHNTLPKITVITFGLN